MNNEIEKVSQESLKRLNESTKAKRKRYTNPSQLYNATVMAYKFIKNMTEYEQKSGKSSYTEVHVKSLNRKNTHGKLYATAMVYLLVCLIMMGVL